jgi:hypothetical protein
MSYLHESLLIVPDGGVLLRSRFLATRLPTFDNLAQEDAKGASSA